MATADELLELAEAKFKSEAPTHDYADEDEFDDYDPIEDSVNGAVEKVRVVSDFQTHLLPDGSVEFGVACTVTNSQHFGNSLYFLTVTSMEDDVFDESGPSLKRGAVLTATYASRFWRDPALPSSKRFYI